MKDKIAREMNDQTYKEDEYCKIHWLQLDWLCQFK